MCVHKSAISVAEMAKMVGLSRTRFYQLVGSTFPSPIYDVASRRPFYPADLQEVCLEVRRRNLGFDGKPILFHRRQEKVAPPSPKRSRRKKRPNEDCYRDLVEGLKSLGLACVTTAQVEAALKEINLSGMDDGEVLRTVFLHLKRQDTSPPVTKPKPSQGADEHRERGA